MKRWLPLVAAGLCAAGCRPPATPAKAAEPAIPVRLAETLGESGIRFKHSHGGFGKKYFLETSGAGLCFFDYDNDGDPDLYLVQSGTLPGRPGYGKSNRSALYRNDGKGRFTDVTDQAGVTNDRYGQGACAGDYDNDGDLDLYVTNYGANRLYRNNGDGTFTDVGATVGAQGSGYHTSAAFSDYDNDGDLDLYVARYARYRIGMDPPCSQAPGSHSYCPPAEFEGDADLLLRNEGGRFKDVTTVAGVRDPDGKGLGVVWVDYDDDGWQDLFVANDGTLNRLYRNLQNGRFEDATMAAGVGLSETGGLTAGMGTDAGDYDNDGRQDLFVANFSAEPNDLYRNVDGRFFEARSQAAGLATPSLPFSGFGAAFVDYDLDGLLDVLVANGHVQDDIHLSSPGVTYAEPDSLYRNRGDGTFQDVSREVGPDLQRLTLSRGLAYADCDGDGDLDFAISNANGSPNLLRNDGAEAHNWVRFRLRAVQGDTHAIGARVTLFLNGKRLIRDIRSGGSYCSQHELIATFGLGSAQRFDRVQVRWPGRATESWALSEIKKVHQLREGSGEAATKR